MLKHRSWIPFLHFKHHLREFFPQNPQRFVVGQGSKKWPFPSKRMYYIQTSSGGIEKAEGFEYTRLPTSTYRWTCCGPCLVPKTGCRHMFGHNPDVLFGVQTSISLSNALFFFFLIDVKFVGSFVFCSLKRSGENALTTNLTVYLTYIYPFDPMLTVSVHSKIMLFSNI